ncbi:CdaR family transcriptional regulator [Acetobacterium sp. KB-1]|jgi:hypothetical protein|uniref:PucR family transcriptional regulator n=1 Tax=Acetobacterium sp. KB-1 TaxID=2184575 RepID=UPI0013A69667|nr:helix-turn-helix domain-containing protein [Acetobacterium sp. KB-1]
MQIIADQIVDLKPTLHLSENKKLNLISARLLNSNSDLFETGYVYVGLTEQFQTYDHFEAATGIILIGTADAASLAVFKDVDYLLINNESPISDVLNRILGVFDAYNLWDERLKKSIIDKHDLQSILDIGYEKLTNPIALFDNTQICLAKSGNLPSNYDETVWLEVVQFGQISVDYFSTYDRTYVDTLMKAKDAYITEQKSSLYKEERYKHMIANIFVNEKRVGNMGVVDLIAPFTFGQLSIVNHLSKVFADAISNNHNYMISTQGIDYVTFRLISGKQIDRETVQYQLSKRNWKLEDQYYLINFDYFYSGDFSKNEKKTVYYEFCVNFINQTLPQSIVFKYRDQIVAVIKIDTEVNTYEKVHTLLGEIIDKLHCYCGISNQFSDYYNILFYYKQAVKALSLGFLTKGEEKIYHYTNYFMKHMIDLCSKSIDLSVLLHPDVITLSQYDTKNGTDYVMNLYVYLLCGRNIAQAAEKLIIHRNTFNYRITKIIDMMNVDLSDDAVTMHILISCYMSLSS